MRRILGRKLNICAMCDTTAQSENPHKFISGERECILCEDCYNAIKSVCNIIINEKLDKIDLKKDNTPKKTKSKPKSKPKTNNKKKSSGAE